jgi:hypothetical protein
MTTADLLGPTGPTSTPTDDTDKRLYRLAGLGGIGAFLAWVGQPILVILIIGAGGDPGPDWAEIESSEYGGAAEVLIFSAIGVGLLFLVLATARLVARRSPVASVAATVGQVMGLVAAGSWFLAAAESFRMYTSIGAGIPDVTEDPALQGVITHGTALDITGALLLFVICYTGWVVMLATAGRRAGVVGTPLSVVLAVSTLGVLPSLALPFSVPWPMLGYVVTMPILGIAFLIRARR